MSNLIVHTSDPITVIGAGDLSQSTFKVALTRTHQIIAADGGAAAALSFGHMPDAVIGDMDSLPEDQKRQIDPARCHPVTEQDSTDFEKVLQRVLAPLYLCVGFLGGRVDHALACFTALTRFADRKVLLLGEVDLVFLAPPTFDLQLPVGTRFSIYPLAAVEAQSDGLEWPLDDLTLAPLGQIGTSNRVSGPVKLTVDAPAALIIVPAQFVDEVSLALRDAAPWPVRAE